MIVTILTKVNRKNCGFNPGRKSDKAELENGTLLQTASAIGKKEHVRLLLDFGWEFKLLRKRKTTFQAVPDICLFPQIINLKNPKCIIFQHKLPCDKICNVFHDFVDIFVVVLMASLMFLLESLWKKSAPSSVAAVVVTNISGVFRVIKVSKKCQKSLFSPLQPKPSLTSWFIALQVLCVKRTLLYVKRNLQCSLGHKYLLN